MAKTVFIGIDIGGTNLRAALVNRTGKILRRITTEIRIDLGADAASEELISRCRDLCEAAGTSGLQVEAVGLGVAGRIDKEKRSVVFSPNLPSMRNYPLGRMLFESIGIPVYVENDANCFGLGESLAGAGRGIRNWVGITLGTGTGGCLMLDGELWEGDGLGFSGEFGHMIVEPGGPPCPCGSKGCLESFASARALVRGARELHEKGELEDESLRTLVERGNLTAKALWGRARAGSSSARSLFERAGWALGITIAGLFSALGIRHAIIGGGVSAAWECIEGPIRDSLRQNLSMLEPERAIVVRAALGDDAAVIGAAAMAGKRLEAAENRK